MPAAPLSVSHSASTNIVVDLSKDALIASSRDSAGQAPAVGFVSLGCAKALVDAERILTHLRSEGYRLVDDCRDAGLVIVNTCGFIDSAREESFASIHEALDAQVKVVVTGCLGADAVALAERFPQLAGITGPADDQAVMHLVHQHLPVPTTADKRFLELVPSGVKLTPRHYAYVKIAEGCNHSCSFCIIPAMRGTLASRPLGEVMTECEQLVADGVKELLVIAQDTSAYGADLRYGQSNWHGQSYHSSLSSLAECLSGLGVWIRLHYLYPYPHLSKLIPLMSQGSILPYLDMPLQHGNTEVLKAMRRPHASEKVLQRLAEWRKLCPELTVRSTFIVGFPGESEAQFLDLLDFIREAQLDRVGAFAYSPVKGAAANALGSHLSPQEQQNRLEEFMLVQQQISARKLAQKIGTRQDVMVDEVHASSRQLVCRSRGDAPEVDGLVYVACAAERPSLPAPGEVVEVVIDQADEHDLFASLA